MWEQVFGESGVSQLCEKEPGEEQCLSERLDLSGWPGIHREMSREHS